MPVSLKIGRKVEFNFKLPTGANKTDLEAWLECINKFNSTSINN